MKRVKILSLSALASVVASAATGIPAQPQLNVEADATGLLKATVTVKAPNVDTDGAPLASLSKIEIKRGKETVKVFDNIQPGEEYKYTDNSVNTGYMTYSAVASATAGTSQSSEQVTVFVGVDEPLAPEQFRASVSSGKISFTWSKSARTGANGERVNLNAVTYMLEELDDSYSPRRTLSESKTQSYDAYMPTDNGDQDIVRFGLRAYNSSGYSDYKYVKVVTGAPYYFPYCESFSCGTASGLCWQDGDADFLMITDEASDADAGALSCVPAADGSSSSFNMGKISMANTVNPRMSFSLKGLAEGEQFEFVVARADGAEATLLKINGPVADWSNYNVDLSKLTKERYIIPKFKLGNGNTKAVILDDIKFVDPFRHDLSLFIEAPERFIDETPITLIITNEGLQPASNAWADINVDGKYIKTVRLQGTLNPGETQRIATTVDIKGEDSVEVSAILKWEMDVNPINNNACAQIIPEGGTQAAPGSTSVAEMSSDMTNDEIYLLDGTRLSETDKANLPAGMYVINGQKTLIK